MLHFPPWLFQLTETICTDTNRFQSTGEKTETSTGSLYKFWFLTEMLSVAWAGNQVIDIHLLPTLCTAEAPWLSNYVESSILNEYSANGQKTRFNWSVKKWKETGKGSNMSFIKLICSCVCVGVCTCFRDPHVNQSQTNYLCDWINHDLKYGD